MRYNIEADGYNELYSNYNLLKGDIVFPTNTFEEAYYKIKSIDQKTVQMKVMKVTFTLDAEDDEVEGFKYKVHIGTGYIGNFKSEVKLSKNQMISSEEFGLAKVLSIAKEGGVNYVEVELIDFQDVQAVYHTNNSSGEYKSFLYWERALQEVMQSRSQNIKCWMC